MKVITRFMPTRDKHWEHGHFFVLPTIELHWETTFFNIRFRWLSYLFRIKFERGLK